MKVAVLVLSLASPLLLSGLPLVALAAESQAPQHECPTRCGCYHVEGLLSADCWARSLLSIPERIHRMVQILELSNNDIRIIDEIDHFPELQRLYMSRNRIQAIPSTAFQNLPSLEYLDLSFNNIADLSQINAFTFVQNNTKLRELNLDGNPITNLGKQTKTVTSVLSSPSLQRLHLSYCKIDSIAGMWPLNNLPKLEYLDLSHNPIKWMKGFGSYSLIHLDLTHCELDFLSPTSLEYLPSLRNLSLSRNAALSLSTGGLLSSGLSYFEAEYCSLTRPGLGGLPNLIRANFKGNKIIRLGQEEFSTNRHLKELDLSENLINEIHSDAFFGADFLEYLSLAHNSLRNDIPPEIFTRNIYLQFLNVSKNDITSLKNFDNPFLRYLDASQCKIRTFDEDVFEKLPNLSNLSLSQNLLEDIPSDVSSPALVALDLSYCRLSMIRNETFSGLRMLRSLDLTGNRLTEPFHVVVVQQLPRLSSLRLADNPWRCDCESKAMRALWAHLTAGYGIVAAPERSLVRCQAPESVRGISWENACYNQWNPAEETAKQRFTRYGVVLLSCFFAVAAGLLAVSAVTKRVRRCKKRRRAHEESRRREERRAQERLDVLERRAAELELPRDVVTQLRESSFSLPPSYEEAVFLMSRRRSRVAAPPTSPDIPPRHAADEPRGGAPAGESHGADEARGDDGGAAPGANSSAQADDGCGEEYSGSPSLVSLRAPPTSEAHSGSVDEDFSLPLAAALKNLVDAEPSSTAV